MIPVILSGGAGTRLWPLSRAMHPKQFHALTGEHTLIQKTVLRIRGAGYTHAPFVLCNEDHRFMVAGQLDEIGVKICECTEVEVEREGMKQKMADYAKVSTMVEFMKCFPLLGRKDKNSSQATQFVMSAA